MWTARSEKLPDAAGRGSRFVLDLDSRPATFADAIGGWQSDARFRTLFNSLLADAPFEAFRWEMPAVTTATVRRPLEFVLLDSPDLIRPPEPNAFEDHFTDAEAGVAVFPNLGRDAVLVVPAPATDPSAYGHLAAFVRHAPDRQRHALWRSVGEAMARRLGNPPVWLSTAGAGVSWLHVRLDDRPKYYGFAPYRHSPAEPPNAP